MPIGVQYTVTIREIVRKPYTIGLVVKQIRKIQKIHLQKCSIRKTIAVTAQQTSAHHVT